MRSALYYLNQFLIIDDFCPGKNDFLFKNLLLIKKIISKMLDIINSLSKDDLVKLGKKHKILGHLSNFTNKLLGSQL